MVGKISLEIKKNYFLIATHCSLHKSTIYLRQMDSELAVKEGGGVVFQNAESTTEWSLCVTTEYQD